MPEQVVLVMEQERCCVAEMDLHGGDGGPPGCATCPGPTIRARYRRRSSAQRRHATNLL